MIEHIVYRTKRLSQRRSFVMNDHGLGMKAGCFYFI